jgi:hypothetical protein
MQKVERMSRSVSDKKVTEHFEYGLHANDWRKG